MKSHRSTVNNGDINIEAVQAKNTGLCDNARSFVLEQLINGESLKKILESVAEAIELERPSALCSVLRIDAEGKHLLSGAGGSLPDFYNEAVNGIEIGDGVGSCGTAAFTKKRIIVEDIQTHPYWQLFKELATNANLRSCWSEPIIGSNNKLLGTFAIYHREPSTPDEEDFKLIEFAAQLAAIAIERNQADEKLELLSRIFYQAHEGIVILDAKKTIIDVNPNYSKITGYSREEVIGKNPSVLHSAKQGPEFYTEMQQMVNKHGYWQGEIWNKRKGGELYAEQLTISSLKDEYGNILNYVGLFSDITENKRQQKKLELMAHYDDLTQLPNRTLLADRFNVATAHAKRNQSSLAVCFIDLDNFKIVNDAYGQEIGDQLLIEVAERIKANLRGEDTVSRQGGDEFALLLGGIESWTQCEEALERIHNSLAQPYLIDGHSHKISASTGVTLFPLDDADLDTLLRHADQAMYQAKLAGRNRYAQFNIEDDQSTIQKHAQLQEIQQALVNNNFCLYYQPKVNMKTGGVFGVEALIRWNHPEKGLIPPMEFLPLIDGTDLEIQIGDWVIDEALRQYKIWKEHGLEFEVSVNIASHHLQSSEFVSRLATVIANHRDVDTKYLQLEILESSALGDLDAISTIINACRDALGVHIALDDFGTGYSSLTHLRNLPADTIKIDQSFVRNMLDDSHDCSIIDGVIGLADSFNRLIIAEGVETTQHGLMLLIMGCDQAQGYGIARPMPADDILGWVQNYIPNQEWIECANKYCTLKEKKIKLLEITTEHWVNNVKDKIKSSCECDKNEGTTNAMEPHHSAWMQRARQEDLFEESWLDELAIAYEDMLVISDGLRNKYQAGEIQAARGGLDALQVAYEEIIRLLQLHSIF